jgi:alpha-tubulin suppressor-like RCC1 family protein
MGRPSLGSLGFVSVSSLLCVSLMAGACSSEPTLPPDDAGGEGGAGSDLLAEATARVTPDGKILQTSHVQLTIPAGALSKNVQVSVSELSEAEAADLPTTGDQVPGVSSPVRFTPHGLSFTKEADIEIAYPVGASPKKPVVLKLDDDNDDSWQTVNPANFSATGARFKTKGFSIYRVFDDPDGIADALFTGGGGSGGSGGGSAAGGGTASAGSASGGSASGGAPPVGGAGTAGSAAGGIGPGVGGASAGGAGGAPAEVISVSAGKNFTCSVLSDGTVWCSGTNAAAQLGAPVGTPTQSNTPRQLTKVTDAVVVSAGAAHACAILADRSLVCWGDNSAGQLGGGTFGVPSDAPVAVDLGGGVVMDVAAGQNHTCALLDTGIVKCWGENDLGQLGNPYYQTSPVPVEIESDGVPVPNLIALSSGNAFSCAVQSGGALYCWGDNSNGQMGQSYYAPQTSPTPVYGVNAVDVSTGGEHVCAILYDGSVSCWGANAALQCGQLTPPQSYQPAVVTGVTNAVVIEVGEAHSCAVDAGGNAHCWGRGDGGQLGDGTNTSSATPLKVSGAGYTEITAGATHTCARDQKGGLSCWGPDELGQLGYVGGASTPKPVAF